MNQTETLFCGIDPGLKGGIVFLADSGKIFYKFPMLADTGAIAEFFTKFTYTHLERYKLRFFLEKAQAMPNQGVVSMFNYGSHFGSLVGILSTLGAVYTLVPPQTWTSKLHTGYDGSSKEKSLKLAKDIFPGEEFLISERSKKPHEGLIDAALIAEFGRRKYMGWI
jgi:crossover junction endodeoxyribonuclease RuvC